MLLTTELKIKINNTSLKHYLDKGYDVKIGEEIIIKVDDLSKSSTYKVIVQCDICGKEKMIIYNKYMKNIEKYNIYSCSNKCATFKNKKTCLEKYGVENFYNKEKYKNTCLEKYGVENVFQTEENKNMSSVNRKKYWNKKLKEFGVLSFEENNNYKLKCDCNKDHNFIIHRDLLHNRKQLKTILCTTCNPPKSFFISGKEIQLQNYIRDFYNGEIKNSIRTIINPYELDIYLPELKLAFEFDGIFWHNEQHKNNNYHLNKTELCEQQGIQLIHIYEDDWLYKQDIVKSIILNKLGKNIINIFANKCEIKEIIDNKLVRTFLDTNHIQGFVCSKIKIGLFYENELVSLMNFEKYNGEYELLRFCNKLNTNVIGSASRLFKNFIKKYNPTEITTYVDRSYSQGEFYETLGFKFVEKTEPNYYYIVDGIRKHRFNYCKNILIEQGYDNNKTEHEIMLDRKIYRIYDSGNLKFKYV